MVGAAGRDAVTVGILAGGAGRRFGGRDKGWIEIDGEPQIVRLVRLIAPQAGCMLISANRSFERYRALGVEVLADAEPGFPGPLAGILALLGATRTPWLVTVPVDVECLPDDFVARMTETSDSAAVAGVAEDDDGLQPLFAAYPRALLASAGDAYAAGERSVQRWQAGLRAERRRFAGIRFGNRNEPAIRDASR